MLVPRFHERPPDATDPRSRWLSVSQQLASMFERLDVDPQSQSSVLQQSVDPDALNAITEAGTATVSFELWDHWVRITPDAVEVYAPDGERTPDADVGGPRS
ncbi:hypothetical protein GRX01_03125 [Halobaculum sp. WSA2]|uniref:Halobacterial output domain-containing protein n=1 Tax=Halobaculum saliterrae TaxID=2073113 RepID=A0A6B0SN66_9EURY|nr:HalOD1 output domain-containing protein [Halobaculum saliterrae]MXR40348.1 hypothetical protein [Halobaculum saliterrae]